MRVLLLLAALAATSAAFAATPTLLPPPTTPAPPSAMVQDAHKVAPGPLRLRDPMLNDDRRIQLRPDVSSPKDGAGPAIR